MFWGEGSWPCPWHAEIGQGSNPCHSSDPSHSRDNAESLTARPPGNASNFFFYARKECYSHRYHYSPIYYNIPRISKHAHHALCHPQPPCEVNVTITSKWMRMEGSEGGQCSQGPTASKRLHKDLNPHLLSPGPPGFAKRITGVEKANQSLTVSSSFQTSTAPCG